MVYVLNIKGQPIMPCKEAKARKLLNTIIKSVLYLGDVQVVILI